MPLGTPFTKIRRTRNFGGNVFLKGKDLFESKNYVNELIKKFVVSLLKKAAAKTGNSVDDKLVEELEKALFS